MKNLKTSFYMLIPFLLFLFLSVKGQTFVKVTDQNNPIVTTTMDNNYSGSAWIDYDNDGDLDLFATKRFLFRNDGNGNFSSVSTNIGNGQSGQSNGISWSDYDNDGDIDLFLAGNPSRLYRNDGNDVFTQIQDGALGINEDNRGWTCTWADYNEDGYLDLLITHPKTFVGSPFLPCLLFTGNGDGRFTKITGFEFTTELAPYTVATWYDYNLDGDEDLFIGSGPAGVAARDYLYENTFSENGIADLQRITTNPIATDLQDGQVWNWFDHDNDGDLDGLVTNYGGASNHFYRNDNGTYTSISNNLVFNGQFLGNSWGDIDNDGDVDVIITGEGSTQVFINEGNDEFTVDSIYLGGVRSASLGDYDEDGDLDFFVSGGSSGKGLYENIISNSNNWIKFNLKGTISNYSAIGTVLRIKANVNGSPIWMTRQITSQNNFNGMHSLRVHFGLGDANTVDSVEIIWPQGDIEYLTNLAANQLYEIEQQIPSGFLRANFGADSINGNLSLNAQFNDLSTTDPVTPITNWQWDFNNDGIVDATTQNPTHFYDQIGTYTVKLLVSNGVTTDTLLRENYISVNDPSGVEILNGETPNSFSLSQNYPNPFNPTTKISWQSPVDGHQSIKVYDVLGNEVAVLVDEYKPAGTYEVDFEATQLGSGIYFYRLQSGSFIETNKMILLK